MTLDRDEVIGTRFEAYRRGAVAGLEFRPFAVTLDRADGHPWESVARHMKNVTMSERYFGFAYIAIGEA